MDGPAVAKKVYTRLFSGVGGDNGEVGGGEEDEGDLDPTVIPYAIDEAVRELRANGVSPIRWATYIHVGM